MAGDALVWFSVVKVCEWHRYAEKAKLRYGIDGKSYAGG